MAQIWNPAQYQATGNFVPTLGEPLLELLSLQSGMKVLDLGCGNGTLTLKIMAHGAQVTGIDASLNMVVAAQQKGVHALHLSADDMNFEQEFDAVFSNAALHWMTQDPAKVLQQVFQALRPGGVFVAEMGGEGNIERIQQAQRQVLKRYNLILDDIAPKFFPSLETYKSMLEKEGFEVSSIQLFKRPTRLPDGVRGWLKVFSTGVLATLPPQEVEPFLNEVEELTRPFLTDEQGWFADYVRLRFVAVKPASLQ